METCEAVASVGVAWVVLGTDLPPLAEPRRPARVELARVDEEVVGRVTRPDPLD